METWRRLDNLLATVEQSAIVLLLSALLSLGLLQVLLRNVFAGGLFWADGLMRHMVVWLGFLGASLATREQRHLRIDALAGALPARWQPCIAILINLAAAAGSALLTHAAWRFVQGEYAAGTVVVLHIPTWIAQSVMPCALLSITLRFAMQALEQLLGLTQRPAK